MQYFDVVIVGAGISGIDAACHLRRFCPGKTFAILEMRGAIGGTWDLFRFPGIRSDSDMYTFGYGFKPWSNPKAISDGATIRHYLAEAVAENALAPHIRYEHRLRSAEWDTDAAQWTLEVEHAGARIPFACNLLFMCSGYFDYEHGYTPEFAGQDRFQGHIVHPQHWPTDLDYSGKRVAIIGSGATAVTLVPAMAADAAHVTMVQRSPSYIVSLPSEDAIANVLRKVLPEKLAYRITRWKYIAWQRWIYHRTRVGPEQVKKKLLSMVRAELGPDYDIATHFTPRYNPWDQRLCLVPDSDFFKAIASGHASVVTDQIDHFTETGLAFASGAELAADIIVTATGLNLLLLGGVQFRVDGKLVDFAQTCTYKGMMFADVPNLMLTFGYINASWTLRADLTAEYFCRLVNRLDELGMRQCTPRLRGEDADMSLGDWIDDFTPGYIQRAMDRFPRQGDRDPWRNTQNYLADRKLVRRAPVDDDALVFSNPSAAGVASQETAQTPSPAQTA